jgi:hypothetical protein
MRWTPGLGSQPNGRHAAKGAQVGHGGDYRRCTWAFLTMGRQRAGIVVKK